MRVLVAGGGARARALTRELVAEGHAVRIVSRGGAHRAEIEAAGGECWVGDPDVVGTLRYALENVTVLLWLLGTAQGEAEQVAALHGSRLAMMLEKTIDTTVRGIVYEAGGTVDPAVLRSGAALVRKMAGYNAIPHAIFAADITDERAWVAAARAALDATLVTAPA